MNNNNNNSKLVCTFLFQGFSSYRLYSIVNSYLPVIEQSKRKVGAFPEY